MSKLVRLTTIDKNCIFNNDLNDDLILEPYSQVAFQNLSLSINKTLLTIDDTNNIINYSIQTAVNKSITLTNAIYDDTNINNLLTDIQTKLNTNLQMINTKDRGLQWLVTQINNRVNLSYKISPTINLFEEQKKPAKDVIFDNVSFTKANMRRDGGVDGTDDSYIYYKKYITPSCGFVRCRLNNLTSSTTGGGTGTSGVILGLMNQIPTSNNISLSNITYGIQAATVNTPYLTILNGTRTATAINPQIVSNVTNNNYLEIRSSGGLIEIGAVRLVGGENRFQSFVVHTYDNSTKLYPVIIFRGELLQVSIQSPTLTIDPFNVDTEKDDIDTLNEQALVAVDNPITVATNNVIEFESNELSQSLGFNNPRVPLTGFIKASSLLNIIADNKIALFDKADNFTVLLDNIDIESYDTLKKQRINILATIPQTDEVNGTVIYDAKFLNFIEMNNRNSISLRNIRARLLDADLETINISGRTTMTIIFKNNK